MQYSADDLAFWCQEESERELDYAAQQRARQYQGGVSGDSVVHALRRAVWHEERAERLKQTAALLYELEDLRRLPP